MRLALPGRLSERRIFHFFLTLPGGIAYIQRSTPSRLETPHMHQESPAFSPEAQTERNRLLLEQTSYLGDIVESHVLPFRIDLDAAPAPDAALRDTLQALEIDAARTALRSVGSLAKINEVDHLGGGLDMIPALLLTLGLVDYERVDFTLENAHASIGYFGALSSLGFLEPQDVIDAFRRGLDIPGHVAWVPGGTQLNGGRLGVMIPTAVGQALGKKARFREDAWVICHCGDAGWISGQALNGFNAADAHDAPITFVMHRNGIQLSGTTGAILDKDPRAMIEAMGVSIIECVSLHNLDGLYAAYREAQALAREGRPSLIYPVGYGRSGERAETLATFAERHGIRREVEAFAAKQSVTLDTPIWTPGALMSYRDLESMIECLFLVNGLPGGKAHHDGHLKGRDVEAVLANPMLQLNSAQQAALDTLQAAPHRTVVTKARPAPGSANLVLPADAVAQVALPAAGKSTSPRAGVQVGYELLAQTFPEQVFLVDCDLAPSTKIDKARAVLDQRHQFEMSIEEQASAIMANGLAMSSHEPQLVVFATFAAFFEGIAREGFEMWRYQRNLNGVNEGLNVTFHLSHVGACTGRDHFSGWALDWITLAMGYLPYLHRFYAPADARSAFIAVRDLAAHYGGHIIGIPRDNLPVIKRQDSDEALWNPGDAWEAITPFRSYPGARHALLAFGATAFLAEEAAAALTAEGLPTDAYVVNGLPLPPNAIAELAQRYPGGLVTAEDGIIAEPSIGLRGFASLVAGCLQDSTTPVRHIGITDPRIAPSDGHMEVWAHFGITAEALVDAVHSLR